MERFCELCGVLHITLIFLADVPCLVTGQEAEAMGTLRVRLRPACSHEGASARYTLIIGKCYRVAGAFRYVNN